MTNYQLVNPHIEGSFKKLFSGGTPFDAAQNAWNNISKYITNNVPRFAFTLERTNDNKLFHFVVKEDITQGVVEYSLERLDLKIPKRAVTAFRTKLKTVKKQYGGKKNDDEDEDDDDDDDDDDYKKDDDYELYKRIKRQMRTSSSEITFWGYYPWYPIDSVFIPTFIPGISPINEYYIFHPWW
jgi:hypothetical protein